MFSPFTLEFEDEGNLLDTNRDATTINIEDVKRQTKAAGFDPDVDDEYPARSDDREEVRSGGSSPYRKIINFSLESVDSSGLCRFL